MKKNNRETGAKAEAIACWFLKQQGYDVLEQNFYTKVGEIDIIAKEDQTLVFVEVKYRKKTEVVKTRLITLIVCLLRLVK